MTPERWLRVKQLLDSALERESGHRVGFLEEACADDDALLREVESLLAAHEKAGSFMKTPVLAPTPRVNTPLSPGTRFGPYEIVAKIGAGGMGEVWKARDTRLNRTVAIKFSQEEFTDRFEREAKAVAALNHANICQLYDVGPNYLVMEYVDGDPITPPGNARNLLGIVVQIADGLAAAHAAGFVHRDLKPDNILVTRDGRVKILDFGLAKHFESPAELDETLTSATTTLTEPGTIAGTPAYMSPEQARGLHVDMRSDQFSFGLVVYEMATGKRAFRSGSAPEILAAIIREEPEPLPASVRAPLRWVIERCLEKDPSERYDSTRDLYRELRQAREHLRDAQPLIGTQSKQVKRGLPVIAVAAAMLAAGFAIAAFWPISPSEQARLIPFATEFELQAMPRWSPQGDRIAYVAPVNDVLQVFTKSLGSSLPTQITHEKEGCLNPLWSADATRIYYLTGTRPVITLRSIAVAGGESKKVLDNVYRADLSTDGKTMAVLVQDVPGSYRLAFSSPPEAPPQPYSQPPLSNFRETGGIGTYLRFDPSGKYLGLYTTSRSRNEFWRIPLDGGPAEELLRGKGPAPGRFTWMNDASSKHPQITNDTALTGMETSLALTDLASGVTRTITRSASRDVTPSFSPQGGKLAFASGEAAYDVISVPLDASAPRPVIATSQNEFAPSWAPDGIRLAYVTDRNGQPEIWLRNRMDGSDRRIVAAGQLPDATQLLDCEISPDGSRVAYRAQGGMGAAIWISPISGDAPVQLWKDPANSPQRGPSWSPDGNWIAYYGVDHGRPAVMKARVGGATPAESLSPMSRNLPVRWSPRDNWIAFRDGEILRIVSPDGKQNRVVSQRAWQTYGWSKDGAALYGIVSGENRRLFLGKIDIAAGRDGNIADIGPVPAAFEFAETIMNEFFYRGFSLNPDGKSFLTSVLRVKTQVYLVDYFDQPTRLADQLWRRR